MLSQDITMTLRYYRIPRCLLLYHSGAGTFSWVLVVHISISICVCVCVCVCVYKTTWFKESTHWRRPWYWQKLKAGEGGDKGWDGWMASLIQWTWVCGNTRRWGRIGKPGMLQSMASQRVGHDRTTEQKQQRTHSLCSYLLGSILGMLKDPFTVQPSYLTD